MFTSADLNTSVGNNRTLLEFIQYSQKKFNEPLLTKEEIEALSSEDLNECINRLNIYWEVELRGE